MLAAADEQGERFLVTGALPAVALSGAQAGVAEHAGVTVLVLRGLDEELAMRLTERTGVAIAIIDYASFEPGEGPLAILNTDALSRGGAVAGYIDELDAYAASLPVAAATGETIALARGAAAGRGGAGHGQRHHDAHLPLRRVHRRARDGEQYFHRAVTGSARSSG